MSEHSSDESGCGCVIVLILLIMFAYLLFPHSRHEDAETICAKQSLGYETPFCKALAEKYRGKP